MGGTGAEGGTGIERGQEFPVPTHRGKLLVRTHMGSLGNSEFRWVDNARFARCLPMRARALTYTGLVYARSGGTMQW